MRSADSAICQVSSTLGPSLPAYTSTPRVGSRTPKLSTCDIA